MIERVGIAVLAALFLACAESNQPVGPTAGATGPPARAARLGLADLPAVAIPPGRSIQAAVDAHPTGTTFLIRAGRHRRQTITPKDGMTFIGEPGAILDGRRTARHAFDGLARNVTIRGLIIENYRSRVQEGAIHGGGHTNAEASTGWVIEGNEIRRNASVGVRTGHRMQVRGNWIHHNGQLGVSGIGDDIVVEGNEIAWNNDQKKFEYRWEAGATKFVQTRRLVVRNNRIHHNWGPGVWMDDDNIDVTVEGNLVEDNADTGIFHEIGYAAVIRNNTVRRNGFDRAAWAYGAGILVAHSPDVEVSGNTVEDNFNGIMAIQQARGSGAYGPHRLDNLHVHHNRIVQRVGQWAAGVAQDVGDRGVFARNLRFLTNQYVLGGATRSFEWENAQRTRAEWLGYGLDAGSQFTP